MQREERKKIDIAVFNIIGAKIHIDIAVFNIMAQTNFLAVSIRIILKNQTMLYANMLSQLLPLFKPLIESLALYSLQQNAKLAI